MQGWPNFLEVKGRVRLDAFEKFLQELPLSRSRAIMIVEFRWKEDSAESGQLYLSEAIHSYITDERVGFAEPAPGVELYLCPPHSKLTAMLGKHLSTDLLDNVERVVNGLVGIIVWRRPHVNVSPRVSSHHHHKHGGLKKHSGGSKKHLDGRNHLPSGSVAPPPEDIDDIPPGFGPRGSRDVEDLPEFDFSRGNRIVSSAPQQHSAGRALPAPPPPPETHVRELIQKYGQGASNARELGIPVQPWNEEDDIPEWNPNPNTKQIYGTQSLPMPPPPQLHVYQQPQHFMMNHPNVQPVMQQPNILHVQPIMQQPNGPFFGAPLRAPVHPQAGVMLQSATPWWPAAHGMPHGGMPGSIRPCHFGGHPSGGRPPGVGWPGMVHGFGGANNGTGSWRPDNSGGRGFF